MSGMISYTAMTITDFRHLDFNTLPSGIYVLRLQIGNDTYETHKIVFK